MVAKDGTPADAAGKENDDADTRIRGGIRRIMPTDWKSGEALWLMDFITPFGGSDQCLKELREKVFKGAKMKSLQPAPSGQGLAVVEW